MDTTEILNTMRKNGLIKYIGKDRGLNEPSVETVDGSIQYVSMRMGGYLMGTNYHSVIENGKPTVYTDIQLAREHFIRSVSLAPMYLMV